LHELRAAGRVYASVHGARTRVRVCQKLIAFVPTALDDSR